MSDNTELKAELAKQGNEVAEFTHGEPVEFRAIAALEIAEKTIAATTKHYSGLIDIAEAEHDALTVQLAAVQAVIAAVERLAKLDLRCPCCTGYQAILEALAQSPTDALEAVKEAAWDEAIEAQRLMTPAHEADLPPNPYRAASIASEPEADR